MPQILLESSDGEIFPVEENFAKFSGIFKTMLMNCSNEDEIVPLPKVHSSILRKILIWADYHKNDPEPNDDEEDLQRRTDDIPEWDVEFLKVDQATLFGLLVAANYLDIKELLKLVCKTVANMIKGKNSEEIRHIFHIKNDLPRAEEQEQDRAE